MINSKKQIISIITIVSMACFYLGFVTAQSMQKTNWAGYLVHGTETFEDISIIPEPSRFSPVVNSHIILGLRGDGVVVWKHVADSADQKN